jgi:hypothetical protein
MTQGLTCKVCEQGTLKKKKKHRLSGPAVVIGYLFLIPSFIGMLIGIVMLMNDGIKKEVRAELSKAGIPSGMIEQVVNHESIPKVELAKLTYDQRKSLTDAMLSYTASTVGAGAGAAIGGALSIFLMIASFCGGLLGWILTMKKKVLQCVACEAVVNAS